MKTDITDKIPTDLRDRWIRHFEDIIAFQDMVERMLIAQIATMRRQRLIAASGGTLFYITEVRTKLQLALKENEAPAAHDLIRADRDEWKS